MVQGETDEHDSFGNKATNSTLSLYSEDDTCLLKESTTREKERFVAIKEHWFIESDVL